MLRKITFPQWLDGQTIALLTLLAALGAMMQTGFGDIRGEIRQLRNEVRGEIGEVRGEIGEVRGEIGEVRYEIGQLRSEVRTDLHRLDDRLRNVELEVGSIKAGMAPAAGSAREHREKGVSER